MRLVAAFPLQIHNEMINRERERERGVVVLIRFHKPKNPNAWFI